MWYILLHNYAFWTKEREAILSEENHNHHERHDPQGHRSVCQRYDYQM